MLDSTFKESLVRRGQEYKRKDVVLCCFMSKKMSTIRSRAGDVLADALGGLDRALRVVGHVVA